jgi:Glycosyl hydrolases family 43
LPTSYTNPVLDRDFPDPNVIRAGDGCCYCYATQGLGERPVVNIQVARSRDMVAWEYLGEALPQRPPWAQTTQMLWAPHVVEHGGVYVMAYSAAPDDPPYPPPPDDPALCLGAQGRRERSYLAVWARPRTPRCDGSQPQPHQRPIPPTTA